MQTVRTMSDPGQPSKRKREEHGAKICTVQKLVRGTCERTRNCEEAPRSGDGRRDEENQHTFVMHFFPSQGSQKGITVLVIKGGQD